jgi:alkylation response protein AidB-like acyl-CoA dehydrogenase
MDHHDITLRLDTAERWFAVHAPLAQHLLLAPRLAQALPDCSGVLEVAFEMTLDHLKQRVQFGTPM